MNGVAALGKLVVKNIPRLVAAVYRVVDENLSKKQEVGGE
jgi:hypothetical protein